MRKVIYYYYVKHEVTCIFAHETFFKSVYIYIYINIVNTLLYMVIQNVIKGAENILCTFSQ